MVLPSQGRRMEYERERERVQQFTIMVFIIIYCYYSFINPLSPKCEGFLKEQKAGKRYWK